jgi:hypothetical protein
VRFSVLGEFGSFALNCEENLNGGIGFYSFLEFCSWSHVGPLRWGTTCVSFVRLGEYYLVN